jgi:hypothetical protein
MWETLFRSEPGPNQIHGGGNMKILGFSTQTNRFQVAALVLLAVALAIPPLAWADHASDHPYGQFDDPSSTSASDAHKALLEKYETGELVFHAPGRRDDRSFSTSASEAYEALVEKYGSGELVFHAPGRRDDRSFNALATQERMDAAFLAANPEIMSYRRFAAGPLQQRDAAFLAANPEIMSFRRYAAQQNCLELILQC